MSLYTTLYYSYDHLGNYRAKALQLTAKDVRAKGFGIYSGNSRYLDFGEVPSISITRHWKNLKTDPYNEDGRPPSLWGQLTHPLVEFVDNAIRISGFEKPNMCWAGLPRPAYSMCPKLKLPKNKLWPQAKEGEEADYAGLLDAPCGYRFGDKPPEPLRWQTVILT